MSFTSLEDCLSTNTKVLGENYSQLGTTIKSGWFSRKVFLSFDPKKGWNVVKLGWLQLFLRKFLGFYKSTHLTNIIRAWKEYRKAHVAYKNTALKNRIHALVFPPKKFLSSWGNVDSIEANVFVFPETHTHKNYRKIVNQYINDHYREGDVVLVEGVVAGKAKRNQQVKDLKEGIQVFGWDHPHFKDLANLAVLSKHQHMLAKMERLITELQSKKYDFACFGTMLGKITSEIQKLASYFEPTMSSSDIEAWVKAFYEKSKGADDPRGLFQALVLMAVRSFEKNQEKAFYNHFSSEDVKKVFKSIQLRNQSLVGEIQKYRALGKRVFVIAGSSHLLWRPLGDMAPSVLNEVHSCLKKQKFVMLAEKEELTDKVMKLNKDLFSSLKKVEP